MHFESEPILLPNEELRITVMSVKYDSEIYCLKFLKINIGLGFIGN